MKLRQALVAVCLLFAASGCSDFFVDSEATDPRLNEELADQLEQTPNGADHYRLPDSDDYARIPQDPRNPMTTHKVALGKLLFHETGLAVSGKRPDLSRGTYSCSSCHNSQAGFHSGRLQGVAEGGMGFGFKGEARTADPRFGQDELDIQPIRVPTVLNLAYSEVAFWNGSLGAAGPNAGTEEVWLEGTAMENNRLGFKGPETQAIAGLKDHGLMDQPIPLLTENPKYRSMFEQAFPNLGKDELFMPQQAALAIAAYERALIPDRAPFQRWLRGEQDAMTDAEKRGGILFFGKAECSNCHSGPALGSNEFHALGMENLSGRGILGNRAGDDEGPNLGRGGFTGIPEDNYRFKVPQLYNVGDVEHLGHGGTFRSVRDIIDYKNRGVAKRSDIDRRLLSPHFKPLGLSALEVYDLNAFVEQALRDPDLKRYEPTQDEMPSGNCRINADDASLQSLGCS